MYKGQWAYGAELLATRLTPSRFNNVTDEEHEGYVTVRGVNGYILYGINNVVNAVVKIPYVTWHQEAEEPDNHHRTETISGMRDIRIGFRWIIRNESFGPGQRLFFGMNLNLPTAESYSVNPFSEDADSIEHSHFALGTGHFSNDLNVEWWYRSEFPWVLGASAIYSFSWNTSSLGYQTGQKFTLIMHGIKQKPIFPKTFLYLKMITRYDQPDSWENSKASNSGGLFMDGMAGFDFEFGEEISGVLTAQFPLWRTIEGVQLDPISFGFSVRRVIF